MHNPITGKVVLLSILYVIILLPLTLLFNLGIDWTMDNVVINLINWFNHRTLFWKIVLIFFEIIILFALVLGVIKMIGSFITYLLFSKLPDNYFTIICSTILYLINVGLGIYQIWNLTPPFTFWVFIEFILLVFFTVSVNTILLPWWVKAKAERRRGNIEIN